MTMIATFARRGGASKPGSRIVWNKEEQGRVLYGAALAAVVNPGLSPAELVQVGQVMGLPKHRRREIGSVMGANWDWFHREIDARVKEERERADLARRLLEDWRIEHDDPSPDAM
jgi:hypothetical protein